MDYENIRRGTFVSRPNRFIAMVNIDGKIEICHVKNTGRCRELLIPGVTVILQEFDSITRKTKFDVIAVYKGNLLINMDSQAPNKVAKEIIHEMFDNVTLMKPEYTYKNSRLDFYIETTTDRILMEVKGVTLEKDGVAMFPDAPTERGKKHLNELSFAISEGYKACILFVIQMKGCHCFVPNNQTHPAFGQALKAAEKTGVKIFAVDCVVTENSLIADKTVEVRL